MAIGYDIEFEKFKWSFCVCV